MQLFLSWLELQRGEPDPELEAFLVERFRDEFAPAFEAWLAQALGDEARQANQRADNFVLVAVIMATVLFFAGVATHFHDRRLRQALLGLAIVLLVGGIAFMFGMPQSIAV